MPSGLLAEFLRTVRERDRESSSDTLLLLGAIHSYHITLKALVYAVAEGGIEDLRLAMENAEGWLSDAGNVDEATAAT